MLLDEIGRGTATHCHAFNNLGSKHDNMTNFLVLLQATATASGLPVARSQGCLNYQAAESDFIRLPISSASSP